MVGVTVTDDSVLEMIDQREQAPRLPVMVLLEDDVEELADAHVYLDPENEEAPLAVDLLLGTQGWRRFALVDTAKFIAEHGELAAACIWLCESSPIGLLVALQRRLWSLRRKAAEFDDALP